MRCCPVCYSKVRPTVYGTATTGTSLEIKYKIQCRNCRFGYTMYVVEDITGTHTDPYHYKLYFHTDILPDVEVRS